MAVFRTFLFAPGNHPRRVEKSLTLGADAVILDLEDAVAIAEKEPARAAVLAALQGPRPCAGYVRVNALSTPWCFGDLHAVVQPGVDGIVLPKVESPDDLKIAEWTVAQLERERGLPVGGIDIMPILETGLGLSAIGAIAASGTRVKRLSFGAGDFTLDLGMEWSRDELELLPYRAAFVTASRAAGLEPPIDTVWVRIQDAEGFAASAERGRALGFQGRLCIYPAQVPVANAAFTPTDEQVSAARRIVDAFREAEERGSASIQVDGKFVDYPIVYQAERLLSKADAISRRTNA